MNDQPSRQNASLKRKGSQEPDGSLSVLATRRLGTDADEVAIASSILHDGGLVAFPTETVYGLGADAANAQAVARLYAAKGRPQFNPLIAHVADLDQAQRLGVFNPRARLLASTFWPGPLTLVVPAAADCPVCELARAGHDTIAIRVPVHPVARAFIVAFGGAIVAPSANRSGRVSPTQASHVLADMDGRINAVIDGGAAMVGVESTILACLDDHIRLLRPGGIAREEIESLLGMPVNMPLDVMTGEDAPLAPGMLASHYAPRAKVRLDAREVYEGEAWLGFGASTPVDLAKAVAVRNLSESGDLAEAAARLFSDLRELDESGAATIAVAPIPNHGLGEAIIDRLRRAAAPRPRPALYDQSQ